MGNISDMIKSIFKRKCIHEWYYIDTYTACDVAKEYPEWEVKSTVSSIQSLWSTTIKVCLKCNKVVDKTEEFKAEVIKAVEEARARRKKAIQIWSDSKRKD